MTIAIVDTGSGNLRSVAKALEWAVDKAGHATRVIVTDDPAEVASAERLVMPGQGAFADCRRHLAAAPGLELALGRAVLERGTPFFGICVGMQLLADVGREHGDHDGLSWIGGACVPLVANEPGQKIPHMGWSDLTLGEVEHPVLAGVATGDHAYFVHSYHLVGVAPARVLATADYGGPIVAIVGRDNIIATQFHVEKSQATGLRMLANFVGWRP